jgi:hypothetical protein
MGTSRFREKDMDGKQGEKSKKKNGAAANSLAGVHGLSTMKYGLRENGNSLEWTAR